MWQLWDESRPAVDTEAVKGIVGPDCDVQTLIPLLQAWNGNIRLP